MVRPSAFQTAEDHQVEARRNEADEAAVVRQPQQSLVQSEAQEQPQPKIVEPLMPERRLLGGVAEQEELAKIVPAQPEPGEEPPRHGLLPVDDTGARPLACSPGSRIVDLRR